MLQAGGVVRRSPVLTNNLNNSPLLHGSGQEFAPLLANGVGVGEALLLKQTAIKTASEQAALQAARAAEAARQRGGAAAGPPPAGGPGGGAAPSAGGFNPPPPAASLNSGSGVRSPGLPPAKLSSEGTSGLNSLERDGAGSGTNSSGTNKAVEENMDLDLPIGGGKKKSGKRSGARRSNDHVGLFSSLAKKMRKCWAMLRSSSSR